MARPLVFHLRYTSMAFVKATGTVTLSAQPADTDTLTIGAKVYTFQTTLTDVDGNVKIGADFATTLSNLAAAINLGTGAGTAYADSMTLNAYVSAVATATTCVVTAKSAGLVYNQVAFSTDIVTGLSSITGSGFLTSGTGDPGSVLEDIIAYEQVNAGILQKLASIGVTG